MPLSRKRKTKKKGKPMPESKMMKSLTKDGFFEELWRKLKIK